MGEARLGPAPEHGLAAEFQDALGRLEVRPLSIEVDVSHPDPVAAAKQDFFGYDFQPRPTFYAVPEVSHELNEDFVGFKPIISSAGKGSRHGVFFGALVFADGWELEVAVKPHAADRNDRLGAREAETSCLDDYFTNAAAKKCGFESLEPVGFILNEEGTPFSLTVLDNDLDSLDLISWTRFFEEGYETTGMRDLLYKTAMATAFLHDTGSNNSYHGDLAFRNIGTNPYGHVMLFDWEKGKLSQAPVTDPEEHFGRVWIDIKTLMIDMVKPRAGEQPGVGMFERCEGSWWEGFKDAFLDDYMEIRRELASDGSHHMRRVKDTEVELKMLEQALYLEMSRWDPAAEPAARTAS